MITRDLRLVPVAGGTWASALVCTFVPSSAWWIALGAVAVAAVAAVSLLRRPGAGARAAGVHGRNRSGLLVVALCAAAGATVTCGLAVPDRADAARLDGRVIEVIADISSSASRGGDGRMWFDAQTIRAGATGMPAPLQVPVRIGAEPLEEGGLDLGARVRVVGQAMATDAGERATLVLFATRLRIDHPAEGVLGLAAGVRSDFVERAVRLPEPGAGLLPGLAVGDTRAVSEELNDWMLTSGLSHLTAVSGANCAIVVAAVFWLVALCGGGRALRVLIALAALAAFVVLVTPEPSVIRAATMAALAMLTVLLGRPSAGISVLSLAVTVILVGDPWLAGTPGFALSAAATAALIVLAPPLARGLSRWMPQPLALALAIPLAAQLACGPIIALFAEQQSLIGIAANLLAAPAAPLATVIGLLACLIAPVPVLADLLAASAWLPAAWIAMTAEVTAQLPGAQILVQPGFGAASVVAVLSAALGLLLIRTRGGGAPPVLAVRLAAGVVAVAVALGGARFALSGPLAAATVPDGWSIAACDVGQGDALLVRSAGEVALIDTGEDPALLDACLRSLGIDRIDLLVLTHFDADHVGGVAAVVGRVSTVLHGPAAEPADARTLRMLEQHGASSIEASAGQRGTLGASSWRVLWPRPRSSAFPAGNDASVVMDVSGGGVPSAVFLGDLSATPQRLLLGSGQLRSSYAVVKVAHHGSADQDAGLYDALDPAVAIFSAGEDNDYGHPRRAALDMLAAAGAHLLRTDQQGRILLESREDGVAVWTERSAPGDVDPGG